MRDAAVWVFMVQSTDEGCLAIRPSGSLDSGAPGNAGSATVRANAEACTQQLSGCERQCDSTRIGGLSRHFVIIQQLYAFGSHGLIHDGAAQIAVFDHVTHRTLFDLRMIEVHEERGWAFSDAPVGHFDLEHRLCLRRDAFPNANAVQHPDGGQRQRVRPAIEIGDLAHIAPLRIDYGDVQASPCKSDGKGGKIGRAHV